VTRASRDIWVWLSLAVMALLVVMLLYPLVILLAASFAAGKGGASGWAMLAADAKYRAAIGNTLLLGLLVTITSTLIGAPLAFFTARFQFPGKALIALLPLTTLIVPEVIAAQTWLMILGNNGLLTRWLIERGVAPPSFYGWFGLVTVMTLIYYSYVYIGTLAAIRGFDRQLEEASHSLGVPPAATLLKVMVPVVMPSILASALLVFTLAVGNFAVATILGQRVQLLSVITYQTFVSEFGGDPVMQSTLASVSIGIVAAALFLQRWVTTRGRYEIAQGRGAQPKRLSGWRSFLVALVASLVVVLSLLPLVTLVAGAFTRARGPVMRWGEWTTFNLERVLLNQPDPIVNTLIYAGIATAASLALSTLIGYLAVKKRNFLTPAIDYLAALPLALSGTVLGIGLVMAFTGGLLPLAGTATIIVLAYVVRRLPFGIRNASSTLYNIPNSIEDASISLGVPPLRIQIFRLIDSNLMAQASAYGVVLVAIILIPIALATSVFRIDLFSAR
jgi:iron(III) transport system permease protein